MKIKLLVIALLICVLFVSCDLNNITGDVNSEDSSVETTKAEESSEVEEATEVEEITETKTVETESESETVSEKWTYGWYEYETLKPDQGESMEINSVQINQKEVKGKLEQTAEELSKPGEIVFYGGLDEIIREYPEDTIFGFYVSFVGSLPKDYHQQLYTSRINGNNETHTLQEWRDNYSDYYIVPTEADYREYYIKYNKFFTDIGAYTKGRCICFEGMYFYLFATLDQLLSYECEPDEAWVVFAYPH